MGTTINMQVALSARSTIPENGYVMLAQESWEPYVGHLTKLQAIGWLTKFIFAGPDPASFCPDIIGDGYAKTIYAFPSKDNLNFRIGCSNGTITQGAIQYLDFTELIQVNLDKTPSLKYPALRLTSYIWEGEVYNSKGEVVTPPQINLNSHAPILSASVYGSLRLTYQTFRHTYTVTIQPRAEYQENKFQSFIWAIWNGGTTWIEVEAPLGAESDSSAMSCLSKYDGSAGQFSPVAGTTGKTILPSGFDGSEEEPFGKVEGEDETVNIDYCTQLIV